jgi:hypothetical protein
MAKLLTAAQSGDSDDIAAATNEVEVVLPAQ